MEKVTKDVKTNPAATANLLSTIFFWWLNPLFCTGYKRRLEEDDMYEVLAEDRSERLGQDLHRALQSVMWGGSDQRLSQPLLAHRQLLSTGELSRREPRAELERLKE